MRPRSRSSCAASSRARAASSGALTRALPRAARAELLTYVEVLLDGGDDCRRLRPLPYEHRADQSAVADDELPVTDLRLGELGHDLLVPVLGFDGADRHHRQTDALQDDDRAL